MFDEKAGPKTKSSQNQYRFGVLVGNHIQDRFGCDNLMGRGQPAPTPVSEMKSKHSQYSTLNIYQFPPKSTDDLILERENNHLAEYTGFHKRGVKGHIFFGHGANQDTFEKRDFGTTNNLFINKKMKTNQIIDPHYYHNYKKDQLDKKMQSSNFQTTNPLRSKSMAPPLMSKQSVGQGRVPKSYFEATKTFDQEFRKTDLRGF